MTTLKNFFLLAFVVIAFAACKDDDEPTPANSATFKVTIENVFDQYSYFESGTTNFLPPGESEEITFHAGKGHYLSFETMFGQSNDLFYAFDEKGLALYDQSGNPLTGDVTSQVNLWDAGTEVNEEPGTGPNQAPRQSAPNTGMDENGTVQLVADVNDGFNYPADESVLKLTLSHDGGTLFTLKIENISGSASVTTPLAPGVWAVHGSGAQLFEAGKTASAGLEAAAEDGDNSTLATATAMATGYSSPIAPGVWAVHDGSVNALFENGVTDRGDGLEGLAEDANPAGLNTALTGATGIRSTGIFNTPEGSSNAGPIFPGNKFSFTFTGEEGDYLSFATMLGQSNDLFFAFGEKGLALFSNGTAAQGDVTSGVLIWDAGTEVNEYPGAGNNQAPRQSGPNTGADENGVVRPVSDGFTYPQAKDAIKVTLEVMQ